MSKLNIKGKENRKSKGHNTPNKAYRDHTNNGTQKDYIIKSKSGIDGDLNIDPLYKDGEIVNIYLRKGGMAIDLNLQEMILLKDIIDKAILSEELRVPF
ncbi:hypothetical protein [Clostridium baratii]|uniref:hypothetical protein n=1 Tax=Clostridium baratii TaxID=1561 RepID=UPI0030CAA95F